MPRLTLAGVGISPKEAAVTAQARPTAMPSPRGGVCQTPLKVLSSLGTRVGWGGLESPLSLQRVEGKD